jgi:hypothetical protein
MSAITRSGATAARSARVASPPVAAVNVMYPSGCSSLTRKWRVAKSSSTISTRAGPARWGAGTAGSPASRSTVSPAAASSSRVASSSPGDEPVAVRQLELVECDGGSARASSSSPGRSTWASSLVTSSSSTWWARAAASSTALISAVTTAIAPCDAAGSTIASGPTQYESPRSRAA